MKCWAHVVCGRKGKLLLFTLERKTLDKGPKRQSKPPPLCSGHCAARESEIADKASSMGMWMMPYPAVPDLDYPERVKNLRGHRHISNKLL
jgi:hypothetical protein